MHRYYLFLYQTALPDCFSSGFFIQVFHKELSNLISLLQQGYIDDSDVIPDEKQIQDEAESPAVEVLKVSKDNIPCRF